MSNVIKAYCVRYDDEAKKTIDSHLRMKEIDLRRSVLMKEHEKQIAQFVEKSQDGFVEGLKAAVVEEIPSAAETEKKTTEIIENANKEARTIIDQAKQDAEQIKNDAYDQAKKKGYDDGMLQIKQETSRLQAEYGDKTKKLQKEYDDMVHSLEPQIAQIIAALVEKLTGVMAGEKEEVILYLINNSIKNVDKSDEYTIRVSKEDYEYVSKRKDILLSTIGNQVPLNIVEDSSLTKNQCLIETDSHVINCSLDVQLNNLITDLKLMSGV